MAIETTHTLERLSASSSKDSGNKNKHEVVTNNKEKHSRARTPEEGICLEFEEFNPEVTEKQQRHEKRNKGPGKKEFKNKRDNKDINFFDEDVAVCQKPGKISENVSTSDTEGNQTIIYSKPDKKRKGEKFQVKTPPETSLTAHKSESDEKMKDKSGNLETILEPVLVAAEEIVSTKIKLADKIGIFENKKLDSKREKERRYQNSGKETFRSEKSLIRKSEDLEQGYNIRKHNNDKKDKDQPWKDPIRTEKLPLKISDDFGQAFVTDKVLTVEENKISAKNGKERDRGVEVYMETVRQRSAVRDKQPLTTELFQRQQIIPPDSATMETLEPSDEDTNVGLPSVRKLLARFENSQDGDNPENSQARSKSRIVKSNSIHGGEVRAKKTPSARKVSHSLYESDSRAIVVPSPSFRAVEKKMSQSHHQTVNHFDRDDGICQNTRNNQSKHWDPQYFVQCLYKIPTLGESHSGSEEEGFISLEANNSCPTIEGYMERLPAGRKKSTMWNSWKRQYFVAKNGVLNIFEDKTQGELLGKFELFGGHVDFMDSNMLGIQDRYN